MNQVDNDGCDESCQKQIEGSGRSTLNVCMYLRLKCEFDCVLWTLAVCLKDNTKL